MRDMPYTYKGKLTTIGGVTGRYCDNPECEEVVMEMGESIRTTREMLAFNKKVNAKLTPIDLLANVRQRFKLTQQQAAKVFGGGANAFSRYESGKTKPPLALIKLFRILDKHPDLFQEVSGMSVAARKAGKTRTASVSRRQQ
jgi:HTH-type transcriptional regulator/antitoxin MqsA